MSPVRGERRAPFGGSGITLVEVAVALLLLSVGALALAGGIAHALKAREAALGSALALAAAESWLEGWRASPWGSVPDSGASPVFWGRREGTLAWRLTALGPCLAEARVVVAPPAERSAPVVLVTRRFREEVADCAG